MTVALLIQTETIKKIIKTACIINHLTGDKYYDALSYKKIS